MSLLLLSRKATCSSKGYRHGTRMNCVFLCNIWGANSIQSAISMEKASPEVNLSFFKSGKPSGDFTENKKKDSTKL